MYPSVGSKDDGAFSNFYTINPEDSEELDMIQKFLSENYVEDAESCFRFDYSIDFLRWALLPPHRLKSWYIAIKSENSLIGFISAIPIILSFNSSNRKCAEVNFLCVDKSHRNIGLASLLICEITKRCNLEGYYEAIYTTSRQLSKSLCSAIYWHRPLNFRKLIETEFISLPEKLDINSIIEECECYEKSTFSSNDQYLPVTSDDIDWMHKSFNESQSVNVFPVFDLEEFSHWMDMKRDVIYTYVCREKKSFFSFYSIPSRKISNSEPSHIRTAYLFYFSAGSSSIDQLLQNALLKAKKENFDLFNCLDIGEVDKAFELLNFSMGNGVLNYYYYVQNSNFFSFNSSKKSDIGIYML